MSRPSPTESAKDFPRAVKRGNDGRMYESRQNAAGHFQWKWVGTKIHNPVHHTIPNANTGHPIPHAKTLVVAPTPRRKTRGSPFAYRIFALNPRVVKQIQRVGTVTTLDNGGDAFQVNLYPAHIEVRRTGAKRIVFQVAEVDEVWAGCGTYHDIYDMFQPGHAVLIRKGQTCWLVGVDISRFVLRAGETILYYFSTVCNSGVPYGFVRTSQRYLTVASNNCESACLDAQTFEARGLSTQEALNELTCLQTGQPFEVRTLVKRV